jgi:hypothetical protein
MSVEAPSLFAQAIQEHLELKERNSELEGDMPLDGYKSSDPFVNHPLFKSEEQARLEETLEGEPAVVAEVEAQAAPWPGEETRENGANLEDSLWAKTSRDFDWGD